MTAPSTPWDAGSVVGQIEVVGAVIVSGARGELVLCAQRGPEGDQGGLWEFPGGKIESGETPQSALAREIREELGCEIAVGSRVTATTHAYASITITLTTYYCTLVSGRPVPREHAALRWEPRDRLERLDWAPADIPAMRLVMRSGPPG